MSIKHTSRVLRSLVMCICLSQFLGCQVTETSMGSSALQELDMTAVSPALRDELGRLLGVYAYALQSSDTDAVAKLLSAEMRDRIAEHLPGADFASNLQSFVLEEQHMLARSIGQLKGSGELFTVTSARSLADGTIVSINVSNDGTPLPKPFYFVEEDGGYKLDMVPANIEPAGVSTYRVKNQDSDSRTFSCSSSPDYTIAPNGSEMKVECVDTCHTFLAWGTRFSVKNSSADCVYNAWGVDMTIRNGFPVCTSPC